MEKIEADARMITSAVLGAAVISLLFYLGLKTPRHDEIDKAYKTLESPLGTAGHTLRLLNPNTVVEINPKGKVEIIYDFTITAKGKASEVKARKASPNVERYLEDAQNKSSEIHAIACNFSQKAADVTSKFKIADNYYKTGKLFYESHCRHG